MGQYVDIVRLHLLLAQQLPIVQLHMQLVHAEIPHTKGEAYCSHQAVLPHMHHSRDANLHRLLMLRQPTDVDEIEEEALSRGFEIALEARVQDPQ